MKKIYNAVVSEYELPQLTPEPRYLKCEALTGEWWYKDMQTGEDLPMFTTPIDWTHHDTLTFNQEKVFNEFVENVIDPIEQCQELQKEVDKLKEENEFLKLNNPEANIEHFRVIKENKRKINNLRAENKRLKDSLETMAFTAKVKQEAIDSLITRIDKAIEYINTHYLNANEPELLNILQGSDKE